MMNPQGYIINIGLSIIVGLVFAGVQSDDVIRNDLPWWGFAGALLLKKRCWCSGCLATKTPPSKTGSLARWQRTRCAGFLALPFVAALCIGLLLLIVSPRPLTFAGLPGGVCGDLPGAMRRSAHRARGQTASRASWCRVDLRHAACAVSNYHSTTEVLAEALPVVASKGLVVGVFCYLILSSRWTYYRLFCYEEMDHWVRSALDVFIPFSLLGIGLLPTVVDTLQLLFIGA